MFRFDVNPEPLYETLKVSFKIKLAAVQASGGAEP